jgi:chromosome segregation ATPase
VDQVVNTLEMEISWVRSEVKRCEKAIDRNKEEISILQTRLDNLNESMKIVRENEKKREEAASDPGDLKAKVRAGLKKAEKAASKAKKTGGQK